MLADTVDFWLQQLETYRRNCYEELQEMPDGKLTCSHGKDGYHRYCCDIYDEDGQRNRLAITRNLKLRDQLARKAYLTKALKALDSNIAALERLRKRWVPCSPRELIASLPNTFSEIPDEAFFSQRKDMSFADLTASEVERIKAHEAWGASEYARSTMYPEGLRIITSFGLKVRSKAESLIAERLHHFGIPFHYEEKLYLPSGLVVPDFTFEAADKSHFYLEFCGMMNDEKYVKEHWIKRDFYEEVGIVPWRNIVYLYAVDNSLDVQVVDEEIRTKIMAWL